MPNSLLDGMTEVLRYNLLECWQQAPRVVRRADPPGVLSLEPSVFVRQAMRAPAFPAPREKHLAFVAYPWSEEPAMDFRSTSSQEAPEELDALLTRSCSLLVNVAEPHQAPVPQMDSEPSEARRGGPWPDLPEFPPAESAEARAALRQWERLSQLDREQ